MVTCRTRSTSRLRNWNGGWPSCRPDQEIVAYCRGPWCVLSFEAVALLRQRGYRVRRLEDGFPEWKMAGLPIGHNP